MKSHWSVSTHVEQCLTAASFQNIISHCVVSGRHCLKGLCQFCTPVQQFLYWQHNNRRNAMQRQADVLGKWTSSLPELLCHSLVSKAEPWNSQGDVFFLFVKLLLMNLLLGTVGLQPHIKQDGSQLGFYDSIWICFILLSIQLHQRLKYMFVFSLFSYS